MKHILILLLLTITLTKTFAQTDTTIGLTTPGNFGTDYDAIAAALCIDLKTQHQKANAIYNWVTHNITYDVNAMYRPSNGDNDKVAQALKTKKAISTGYAELYTTLCRSVGLSAVTIEGYAKDFMFDDGDEMYIPRHAWNAVKIDGKWQLVDATWGAGSLYRPNSGLHTLLDKLLMRKKLNAKTLKFKFQYDPQYFAQYPGTFRLRHIPIDPLWQLTDTAMPLAIFEAGDSAVIAFNQVSKPALSSHRLDSIATLFSTEKNIELADRAYAYNPRFHLAISIKNNLLADTAINSISTETRPKTADSLIRTASVNLKASLDYLKKQKKHLPEEYIKLNSKSKARSMEVKQYIRQIKVDDKRLLSDSKKHAKTADSKYSRSRKKLGDVERRKRALDPDRISGITTNKTPKETGSPELQAIEDSLIARDTRLQAMMEEMTKEESYIKTTIEHNNDLLDPLFISFATEDSLLRKDATAKLNMHHSYNDEAKQWSSKFKTQRYTITDSLVKHYFAGFDTISAKFEELQKAYITVLDIYKSNMRSLEQYKKWNTDDANLKNKYVNTMIDYGTFIDSASNCITLYGNYLKASKKVFATLRATGKRQFANVTYMEKAEKSRQDLESRTLARKKHTDLKENEKQRNNVQNAIEKLGNARSRASSKHK